ncbi:site-2 protease family protein [Phosphitispora fastidiosa]|uniref:site-2 protease family protein n=1 Tax=Phosphitispora fastidiosa TaxID=2837202 RepID=UPI001E576F02|nr:site-2 protease family protein [Phosphitispora fastidiosa]MBU7005320.1 Zn-dependent protease [Phosphitispora fastidiosa]
MFFDIQTMIYILPALLLGLTLHEFAHAYVASRLGDPTARNLGRLTINPLKHLDPLGTIFLLFFHFGWAKPVPVNPFHFKGDRQRGMLWVSLAGPATNLLIAVVTVLLWRIMMPQGEVIQRILHLIVYINIILAVFNIIPVPPLDGSKILAGILPHKYSHIIYNLEKYGFVILILMMVFGVIDAFLMPIVGFVYDLLFKLAGF